MSSSCPNINLPEWKTLVKAVGQLEAYRDFMETGGQIRTPKEVNAKLLERASEPKEAVNRLRLENPSFQDVIYATSNQKDADGTNSHIDTNALKKGKAMELASKLSESLNIEWQTISENEARQLTANTVNPYSGQPAFFLGDKVYFVQDRMTTDNVLHEFAHPFIESIAIENPQLFDNLYNQLERTEQGREIIATVKKTDGKLSEKYQKAESLVRALAAVGVVEQQNLKPNSLFSRVINNILYAIKQLGRRIFGQDIKISKIDANTSMNELAEILQSGGKIKINTQVLDENSFARYNTDVNDQIFNDVNEIKKEKLQSVINIFYDATVGQISKLINDENYMEIAKLLKDPVYERGDLDAIRANLAKWQTSVKGRAETLVADLQESDKRVRAFVDSLLKLEEVLANVTEHLLDMQNQKDTQELMHKSYYYNQLIEGWSSFMELVNDVMSDPENNISARSELGGLISDINLNITRSRKVIDKMYANGARDAIYTQLEPMKRGLQEKFDEDIAYLQSKNAPIERINKVYRDFHGMNKDEWEDFNRLANKQKAGLLTIQDQKVLKELTKKSMNGISLTKEKIELLLDSQMKDANWYNNYLEGYLYSTDPIVGGLALYVKNAVNDVMIVTQQKFNAFSEDIRQDLKDAGYNPRNIGELGDRLGFRDKVAVRNRDTGELEIKEVLTFLNPFRDYQAARSEKEAAVADAVEEYKRNQNPATQAAMVQAKLELQAFLSTYFNQEYVDEFYARDDFFQDDIGKKAKQQRDQFYDELNALSKKSGMIGDIAGIEDEIALKWREWRLMHSRYDLNGNMKSGEDAQIAARLREVRNYSSQFYENRIRKGVLEKEYFDFKEETMNDSSLSELEKANRIQQWKNDRTRFAIKPEFYEERQAILDRIKEILSVLPKDERLEYDQTEVWERIIELTSPFRDNSNQVDATQMDPAALAEVNKLEKQLEEIRNRQVRPSGLSKEDANRLSDLFKRKKNLSTEEKGEMQRLLAKKKSQRLSDSARLDLDAAYAELRELSTNISTVFYTDVVNNYLSKMDITILKDQYGKEFTNISPTTADFILEPEIVENLREQSPEFREWFDNNHIRTERQVPRKKGKGFETVIAYKRGYAWNVVLPRNKDLLESHVIYDSNGEYADQLDGLPVMQYYNRTVKRKYRTPKVIGSTVDNQGNFLPKTRQQMEQMVAMGKVSEEDAFIFMNEEYENLDKDSAEFRLLEKLKRYHLQNQEGADYNSKLYLQMPRYRKSNLEVLQSTTLGKTTDKVVNWWQYMLKRIKEFFMGAEDDAEALGMNYDARMNIVRADMFDDDQTKVPVSGLFDIDINDVSGDVVLGMMRYMMSLERQKQLISISPAVKAIQSTVKTSAAKNTTEKGAIQGDDDADEMNKRNFLARITARFKTPESKNVRLNAINNLIEREFEGIKMKGWGSDSAMINNISNVLFKRASFSFFALNVPSALKNSLGMKFNAMMFASGGEFVDHLSLQKGNAWAYKMMGKLSFGGQLYNQGAKDHMIQLVEIFDPQQLFEQNFGESMSRTFAKDAASGSWLYSFRKWVEKQAGAQLFAGMMYKLKVKQTINGETKEISYIDAWETVDNQIRLKEGVDVRYGRLPVSEVVKETDTLAGLAAKYNTTEDVITKALGGMTIADKLDRIKEINESRDFDIEQVGLKGKKDPAERTLALQEIDAINAKYDALIEKQGSFKIENTEFKFMKNRVQQVQNDMGGAYAEFDQPEAQRYLAFRFISYMRRYFTAMATKRMGFAGSFLDPRKRVNPGRGNAEMGFYMQTLETLKDIIKSGGEHVNYMLPEEKAAMLQFASEIAMLVTISLLMGLVFGWDDDDEDRIKKLRKLEGGPFGSDDFNAAGWAQVHALHLMMQVRSENEQFNFFTGGLKQYNSLLDLKSVAFGPTTDSYITILDDLKYTITGDERAAYSRDVGPYSWQKKGGSKWINHTAKMFGITGTSVDPALAVENFQAYQAKARR